MWIFEAFIGRRHFFVALIGQTRTQNATSKYLIKKNNNYLIYSHCIFSNVSLFYYSIIKNLDFIKFKIKTLTYTVSRILRKIKYLIVFRKLCDQYYFLKVHSAEKGCHSFLSLRPKKRAQPRSMIHFCKYFVNFKNS
jgi:hypothetical protein